tara:strand:- start:1288 stop:3711 length:2424 start_codon:yes stop_codon:yes gene_type:complete
MATVKIITKNYPYKGALGQVNYDDDFNKQLGIGDIGDLYSRSIPNLNNEANLLAYPDGMSDVYNHEPGILWMYKGSSMEVISCNIINTGVNYGVSGIYAGVYLLDDSLDQYSSINVASGNSIRSLLGTGNGFGTESHIPLLFQGAESDGGNYVGSGGNLGDIATFGYATNGRKVSNIPGAPVGGFIGNSADYSNHINTNMMDFSSEIGLVDDSSYWFIVRAAGNADDWGSDDDRNRSYTKFRVRKKDLRNMWLKGIGGYKNGITNDSDGGAYEVFYWGSKNEGDTINGYTITTKVDGYQSYSTDNYGEGDESWPENDVTSAAFKVKEFAIKITPPTWDPNDIPPTLEDGSRGFFWIDTDDDNDHIHLRPDNKVDYTSTMIDSENNLLKLSDIFDFRPVSYATIPSSTGEVDLQSWYDFGTNGFLYGSAPNIVQLSFKLIENPINTNMDFEYFDYNFESNTWGSEGLGTVSPADIKFKFFVIDWDADNEDLVWEDVMEDLPRNHTELTNYRDLSPGSFEYTDLIDENGDPNYVNHEYETAGVKIIKALVFSYVTQKSANYTSYIQSLRWKGVSIKINLNYNTSILEDFAQIGGYGFTYIPWPYTIPIIGGISEDSGYVNSVENILAENKFNDNEVTDYFRTLTAYNNLPGGALDELGDHIGKVDISQVRYFSDGNFDMNNLLEVSNDVYQDDGSIYYGYDNFDYWVGNPCVHGNQYDCNDNAATYPLYSSVGTIFINDTERLDLRNKCDIELNSNEVDDGKITDTFGNEITGILMGDYNLKKTDYGKDITRTSSPEIPSIDNSEDGAF